MLVLNPFTLLSWTDFTLKAAIPKPLILTCHMVVWFSFEQFYIVIHGTPNQKYTTTWPESDLVTQPVVSS